MGNWNWSKFQSFWFPVILYSGIIFCVSCVPNVKTPLQGIQFDKFLHILVYVPFGFLLARGVYNAKGSVSRGMLLGVVVFGSFLYGISDEIHQSFVPGRNADIIDTIADTIGGVAGGYIYLLFLQYIKNR